MLHLGINNSLQSWNFFELPHKTIHAYCNTGGFGIDGCLSSLIGASSVSPDKLFWGIIGDLAFYYDINALGSLHAGRNIRLMVINNGSGQTMRNHDNPGQFCFGDDAAKFIAAGGHFGGKSRDLIRHYAQDLGFDYISASGKEEYLANLERFTSPEVRDKPLLFEVFTDTKSETNARSTIRYINTAGLFSGPARVNKELHNAVVRVLGPQRCRQVKNTVKNILGSNGIAAVKRLAGRW